MNETELSEREIGLSILKKTLCKTGMHVFIHTSNGAQIEPPDYARCHCEMYSWKEWLALLSKK